MFAGKVLEFKEILQTRVREVFNFPETVMLGLAFSLHNYVSLVINGTAGRVG